MSDSQQIKYDAFLQRAIEHWLDSANELTYQISFCEYLIMKGHVLKYSIKNTNFEHGKDVVTLTPEGTPQAYQLKGGNISLHRWRTEVKPEIEAMIESPIEHPDIDKKTQHISYLVTNGEIEDAARVEIDLLNSKRWAATPLRIWTRGDLLHFFIEMADGFFPKDAKWYKRISDFIFVDGTGLPNLLNVETFLSDLLNLDKVEISKEQRKRDISLAIIYANIISGPYKEKSNHASSVRIMVILVSLIFYIVDTYDLEDRYWLESFKIVWDDLTQSAELLDKEIMDGAFDSDKFSYSDKLLLDYRKQATASIVFGLKMAQFMENKKDWASLLTQQAKERYKSAFSIWGEASYIPSILIMCLLKNFNDSREEAVNVARWIVATILEHNGRTGKNDTALLSPYYEVNEAVNLFVINNEEEIEDNFELKSYFLKAVLEFLVRMGDRIFISNNWKEISFMHFVEFVPDNKTDFYRYRIKNGENRMIAPQRIQSWGALVKQTQASTGDSLPKSICRFPSFLPFYLSVYPHRFNSESMALLFNKSAKS